MKESPNRATFLTAHWRYLAMLNYEIDPKSLLPFLPAQTELDFFGTKTYVSMVGFLFERTRVFGVAIPFHQNFEEINLRFYVRRQVQGSWRRGVVFIKEIVPRWAIAFVARKVYGENYVALPTSHQIQFSAEVPSFVKYAWQLGSSWNSLSITPDGTAFTPAPNSEAEFIVEHYWGYARHSNDASLEYEVHHPKWRIWSSSNSRLQCDAGKLYGSEFAEVLARNPSSAFLAEGSQVSILRGKLCKP